MFVDDGIVISGIRVTSVQLLCVCACGIDLVLPDLLNSEPYKLQPICLLLDLNKMYQ